MTAAACAAAAMAWQHLALLLLLLLPLLPGAACRHASVVRACKQWHSMPLPVDVACLPVGKIATAAGVLQVWRAYDARAAAAPHH